MVHHGLGSLLYPSFLFNRFGLHFNFAMLANTFARRLAADQAVKALVEWAVVFLRIDGLFFRGHGLLLRIS
jgi:hypothetical protein